MDAVMAWVVGGLYAAGIYLLLRRSVVKLLIGLALLGHGANLLIFTAGRLTRGSPPLAAPETAAPPVPYVDPLPQALVLTAIVIGFGVLAFALVLVGGVYRWVGSDDVDDLRSTE
jgi:multicomponent Na+:H+ antiporter subunit C